MDPIRWREIERLCDAALAAPAERRAAVLDESCAGDADLRREVEALLAQTARTNGFLEAPALDDAANVLASRGGGGAADAAGADEDQEAVLLSEGTRLGPYEITAPLGAGGMGTVYEARDTRLERTVALKVLPPGFASDPDRRARFTREAKTIATLNHPHICTLHDTGEVVPTGPRSQVPDPTLPVVSFLVMEHVAGDTLAARLEQDPLPVALACELGAQIADALAAAHRHGVIHRDLKPANIMLTPGTGGVPHVKLLDFGLAKLTGHGEHPIVSREGTHVTDTDSLTARGTILGTLPYMAPEQLEGQPADARTDLWALGCVLYEMLTGTRAFAGDSPVSLAASILMGEPPTLATLDTVPPSLDRLLRACLAKRPDDRVRAAHDVAQELRRIVHGRTEADAHRAFRRASWLATAVGILIVAAGAVGVRLLNRAPAAESPSPGSQSLAVLPLLDRSAAQDQVHWCEGIAETLIDALIRMPGLTVRGRQSSFRYSGLDDVRAVGHELNVSRLLTGTLQRSGSRVRVSLRLVDVTSDATLWTETLDGTEERIFELEDGIARAVIRRFGAGRQADGHLDRGTTSVAAYDLYLRARRAVSDRHAADHQRAIPLLERAIGEDPRFAAAHVLLAQVYLALFVSDGVLPRETAYNQAKSALATGLSLDPNGGQALAVSAMLKEGFENDVSGAEADYKRALDRSPGDSLILESHHLFLIGRGRLEEALDELDLLISVDPAVPQFYFYRGRLYYYLRRYADSLMEYEKAFEIEPGHLNSLEWSPFTYLALGQRDRATETVLRFETQDAGWATWVRALIEAVGGHRASAEEYARGRSGFGGTIVNVALGHREEALAAVKRMAARNRGVVAFAFLTHFFDPYRCDPDFVEVLRQTGFEFGPSVKCPGAE